MSGETRCPESGRVEREAYQHPLHPSSEEDRTRPAEDDRPAHLGAERREVGDADSSSAHPPHVPEQDEDSPLQADTPSPQPVPAMPANASGVDAVTTKEQDGPMDPESMYDRRPERFENSPPSKRVDESGFPEGDEQNP